jgi:hypothetical protein
MKCALRLSSARAFQYSNPLFSPNVGEDELSWSIKKSTLFGKANKGRPQMLPT